jgi:D-beta-D-heptose 7-phosphate kinase/D-beta-D-heptose 1-phosphate adenosyltransferase
MEPSTQERRAARILKGTATFEDRFIPDHKELTPLIEHLRRSGCVIVFTTGVWDLFHVGHAEYIQKGKDEAKKLYPDAEHVIMVVGVDTDALTKERKGPKRPIVPEDERYRVLSHLRAVDIITPQYMANELYRLIGHDVRVISTSTADLPADHDDIRKQCAHLVNLPPQAETSTTARIRILAIDGGIEMLTKFRERITALFKEFEDELSS